MNVEDFVHDKDVGKRFNSVKSYYRLGLRTTTPQVYLDARWRRKILDEEEGESNALLARVVIEVHSY